MGSWIVLIVLAGAVFWAVSAYNSLVALANRYRNAFSQIDVQLKRRHDLIPNLVETARAYLVHERATLEAVTAARAGAVAGLARAAADPGDAGALKALGAAEGALGGALGRLFALSEAYPELKSSANMAQLTEELSSTENRVAFARQAFNDAVMSYNNQREVFPANLLAGTFNFQQAALLGIGEEEAHKREVPKVQF